MQHNGRENAELPAMEKSMEGAIDTDCTSISGRQWRKVLYGGSQPGYADNHTQKGLFLSEMVKNANVRQRRIWTVMRDSVAVSQHVCVVGLVGTVWTHSLNGVLDAWILLQLDALFLVLGFVTLVLTTGNIFSASFPRHAFNFALFLTGLYILAPIFQTLTRSFSSDSIWTSTVCLLLVHLLFHDYTYTTMEPATFAVEEPLTPLASPTTPQMSQLDTSQFKHTQSSLVKKKSNPITFSANVSLNASIVASVLIASRLPNGLLVFALMLFSLEFFLFFPLVTHCMRQRSVNIHLGFSCTLIALTMAVIYPVNHLAFSIFVIAIFFITVLAPYWLIKIQQYKFEINGPWDEAKLCVDIGE